MTSPRAASRLQALELAGPAGRIEALLQESEHRDHAAFAVVCHPHPLFGGTLHNKVVHRVAGTLHGLGLAVLRFNFRGVGESEGEHDLGAGELEDARAALDFMRVRYPDARRWLAGFSFGSWVAARLAAGETDIERLILIAPPVRTQDFSAMRTAPVPKHVFHGSADDVAAIADLEAEFPRWAEPKTLRRIEGASHFFDKKLADLSKALEEVLGPAAGTGTSRTT